jgi:iron complex outermembrane receptor protein
MRRFILVQVFVSIALITVGQHSSLSDTIMLHEVVTYGSLKKYQAGAKIESIPGYQINIGQTGSIDRLLMRFTPVYIKSDAGGLSTIRLRGTSPNHTSVNFGGININSLTLGHSNMAGVPVFLFDEFDLQYGSSSAINGSGSIGGALHLGLGSNWTDGIKLKTTISQGSFGEQLYGAKLFAGDGRFESVTRAFYFSLKNNFQFRNPQTGNIENPGSTIERQRGAAIEHLGLIQELNYLFSRKETLKSSVWLGRYWHQIQLSVNENSSAKIPETIDDSHVRFWSEYENRKNPVNLKAGFGYVNERELFNGNRMQNIGTSRLISELEGKYDITASMGYKLGAKYQYIKPEVYAYSSDVIEQEQQADFYLSAFLLAWNRLRLTLNFRQQLVSNFRAPFTPALGAEFRLSGNEFSVLKLNGNISRSYRIPTFNDRYWGTQGNPYLKPEDGMNYEFGLNYVWCQDNFQTELKLNMFYMDVKDWIEWRLGSVDWKAQNVMEVVSEGVELQLNTDWKTELFNINFRTNYSFNPVEAIKDESEGGVIGRQLLYVPKNTGNTCLTLSIKSWNMYVDGSFTGKRFADYTGSYFMPDGYQMKSYFLVNCGFYKEISLLKQKVFLSVAGYNLLNTDYQNTRFYAMPGRSFRIGLSTDITIH